jgi:hypothetical protein
VPVLLFLIASASTDEKSVPISVLWAGSLAVVLAAVITAVTVSLQTKRTLRSAERQLAAQFAHERAMRERDELRVLVDEAVARLDVLVLEALEAGRLRSLIDSNGESSEAAGSSGLEAELKKIFVGLREVDTLAGRLAVRLGQSHSVVETYQAAWRCFGEIYDALLGSDGMPKEKFSEAGEHAGEFMRLCHGLVGSELDIPSDRN